MLYEVALHPSVCDCSEDRAYWNGVAHVLQGMISNCLLADLWNGQLLVELRRRLRAVDQATADRLRRILDRMKDLRRIQPRPLAGSQMPRSNPEWLDEALFSHQQKALFAIVAREASLRGSTAARASGICVPIEDAGLNALWNSRTHTQQKPRCLGQVLPLLSPILSFGRKIHVIDYVIAKAVLDRRKSATRFGEAVKECLRVWGQGARARTEFIVNTEIPPDETIHTCTRAFQFWRRLMQPVIPPDGAAVKVRFWSSTPACNFQRNRFLLSELATAKIGKGFDLFPGTTARQTENVTLLDEASARVVESEFAQLHLDGELDLR